MSGAPSRPEPGQRLPIVPGYPQAYSYEQWRAQKQHYEQTQVALKQQADGSGAWKNTAMTMGMGFFMGMFVGGSVTLLHAGMAGGLKGLDRMAFKRAVGGGTAFGVIFAVGSLVRPH